MELFARARTPLRAGTQIAVGAAAVGLLAIWMTHDQLPIKLVASLFFIVLLVAYIADGYSYKILVDEKSIVEKRLLKTIRIRWQDVDDVVVGHNVTVIKSSKDGQAISIFHPTPGNIFHQFKALTDHDRLRKLAISFSGPFLQQVWSAQKPQRIYAFPSVSTSNYVVSVSPLVVPVVAAIILGDGSIGELEWNELQLFVPFVLLSIYLMYRLGILSRKKVLLLDEEGLHLKNGGEMAIRWADISTVSESLGTLGLGSIIIRSATHSCITISRMTSRFSDLMLQIKKRIPDKVTGGIPGIPGTPY